MDANRHNKAFGALVRHLRLDHQRMGRFWTQQELASATGGKLNAKQIGRIERGEVILDPTQHLEVLANAFRLSEMQKPEFYAAAGFLYRPTEKADYHPLVEKLLTQHGFPALVTTPLADIVAFNTYYLALYGHTPAQISAMRDGPLGPNVLRIFLDDAFERKTYRGGLDGWRQAVMRTMYLFKISSLRYVASERYREILHHLRALYQPEFDYFWRLTDLQMAGPRETAIDPTIRIHHPVYGTMAFLVLRIPQDFVGQQVYCSVFVPLDDDRNYSQLRRETGANSIIVFDVPAIGEGY